MLSKNGLHLEICYAFGDILFKIVKRTKRTQSTRKTIDQRTVDIFDIVTLKTQR